MIPSPEGTATRGSDSSFYSDDQAFQELQRRGTSARSSFEQDVIDEALDRLLAHPHRQAHGHRLANNLRRSARKRLLKEREHEQALAVPESAVAANTTGPFIDEVEAEAAAAAQDVAAAVKGLSPRNRQALFLNLGGTPAAAAKAILAVEERQYRNLVASARRLLNENPVTVNAFEGLRQIFQTHPAVAAGRLAPMLYEWGIGA